MYLKMISALIIFISFPIHCSESSTSAGLLARLCRPLLVTEKRMSKMAIEKAFTQQEKQFSQTLCAKKPSTESEQESFEALKSDIKRELKALNRQKHQQLSYADMSSRTYAAHIKKYQARVRTKAQADAIAFMTRAVENRNNDKKIFAAISKLANVADGIID